MKKIDLGQTLQLLGNAGVIVGILLLVYELSQNRAMMMAQTRHDLSQGLIEVLLQRADEQSGDLLSRGNNGESLTEAESLRYRYMTIANIRYNEDVYYQFRVGLYDQAEYEAQRESWRAVYQSKGIVDVFCDYRRGLSPEFVVEVESLLATYRCE